MKKLFLITIILLLQCFPSYGNVKDSGFICKFIKGDIKKIGYGSYIIPNKNGQNIPTEIGYFFYDKKVERIIFEKNKDKINFTILTEGNFITTDQNIEWGKNINDRFQLDKKTLILKRISKLNILTVRQCEVFFSYNVYLNKMREIRDSIQRQLDKQLKNFSNNFLFGLKNQNKVIKK